MTLTSYQIEQLRKQSGLPPLNQAGGITTSLADKIGATQIVTDQNNAPAPVKEPVKPEQNKGIFASEINFGHSIADALFAGKASDIVAQNSAQHSKDIQMISDKIKENKAQGKDTTRLENFLHTLMKEDPSNYGASLEDIVPSVNKSTKQIIGEGAGVLTDLFTASGGLKPALAGATYGLTHALQQDKGVGGALVDTAIGAVGGKIAEYGFNAVAPYINKAVSAYGTPLLEKLMPHLPQEVVPALEKLAEKATIGSGTGGDAVLGFGNKVADTVTEIPETIARKALNIPKTAEQNIARVFTGTKVKGLGDISKQQGVKDAVGALSTIKENAPNIKVLDADGIEKAFDPAKANFLELPQALQQTKQAVYDQYTKIATEAGDAGVNFGQKDFVALKDVLSKYEGKGYTPAFSNKAKQLSEALDRFGKVNPKDGVTYFPNTKPADIQKLIEQVNLDANPLSDKAGAKVATDFSQELRNLLDSKIESNGNPAYQATRTKYAQLKSVEGDVIKKYKQALRKAGAKPDLIDHITNMDALYGLLTANPTHIALGLGSKALKATLGKVLGEEASLQRAFSLLGDAVPK